MGRLSDVDIITKNPIGNCLDNFRARFQAKYDEIGLSNVKHLVETSQASQG